MFSSSLPLRRRDFGLACAAAAASVSLPALAQTTKLRVSIIPIVDTAPLQCAMAKGYFAEEGLEIDTTPTGGGAAGLPALAAGQVQIAFSNIISIVLGAQQGLGFQVVSAGVATTEKTPDLAGLLAKPGATFKTGKELEGKRIAVNARNGILWLFAREWVRATGGDPDKVTYLEVPFPQMSDALRGDRVEAAFVPEPFFSAGVSGDKLQIVGWPYNTVARRVPIGMFASTKTYIDQNPAVIDKFSRAYLKGVDWANANMASDEWLGIVSGYTKLPVERLRTLAMPPFEKTVDPARLEAVVALMRRNAMFEGALDSRSLLYRTVVPAAR